jgi:hypothetical protein
VLRLSSAVSCVARVALRLVLRPPDTEQVSSALTQPDQGSNTVLGNILLISAGVPAAIAAVLKVPPDCERPRGV